MSYILERAAIEAYISANWSEANIGWDGHKFTPSADSVRLTIANGGTFQGTIGGTQNRIDYIGVLMLQIFTGGGAGSQSWRGYAETLSALFMGQIIDTSGVIITTPSDAFIRFSPGDQYPYIANVEDTPPFSIANLNVPFVRYTML